MSKTWRAAKLDRRALNFGFAEQLAIIARDRLKYVHVDSGFYNKCKQGQLLLQGLTNKEEKLEGGENHDS